jgi:hypothetical protein
MSRPRAGANGWEDVPSEPEGKATFTKNEIAQLYAPLPLAAHSIREGYKNKAKTRVRWFVYLDRIAIQRRLDELFPGQWEFSVNEIHRAEHYVNITATLTIRGVSRSFNGGQSEPANSKSDPENLEKGAMTDTFRRCASLWGFGAYINDGIDIYTAGYADDNWNEKTERETEAKRMFQAWYNEQYTTSEPPIDKPPRTSKRVPTDHIEPANGNGQPKAEPEPETEQPAWQQSKLIDGIAFMYPDDAEGFHRRGTVKNLLEDGTLAPDMPGYVMIEKILLHRAFKDFILDAPMVWKALTIALDNDETVTGFADWYAAMNAQGVDRLEQLPQAWQAVIDYHENANLPLVQSPAAGNDIPL